MTPMYTLTYLLLYVSCQSDLVSMTKCGKINAAFSVGTEDVYFLSGSEYIKYNFYYKTEETVAPLTSLGLGKNLTRPDAAFTHQNGSIYFLKGCSVYSFKRSNEDKFVPESVSNISSWALPCHVDAAINSQSDLIVMKGCQEWLFNPSKEIFELSGNVTDRGLPCDLDAAVEWTDSTSLYIKGVQFWKDYADVVTGPFHTDELNLCSWNLCGENSWMTVKRSGNFSCNGDVRLCPLKLNQVTLAGLHNSGAGFDGRTGIFDCFLRNHGLSITEQLRQGIRHFDIDPCFDNCGLLGTCHTVRCEGGICPMIKQLRSFLRESPDEIVTLNFNHEVQQPEKVFAALNRQLLTQLGPMLNSFFRKSPRHAWPTLKRCVKSNKRVFVFYAPIIEKSPYDLMYRRYKWIHSEKLYGSTWAEFNIHDGCKKVVNITEEKCQSRSWRELLEVSIIPVGFCIRDLANQCRPFYHQSLRACEKFRFIQNESPNVLLVDYPEDASDHTESVYHAVYHQNIRNIYQHRHASCYVKVDAAVKADHHTILFFSGYNIITYSATKFSQINFRMIKELESVDAAYLNLSNNLITVIKGCDTWEINSTTLLPISSQRTGNETCEVDTAVMWNNQLYTFKGCNVTIQGSSVQSLDAWGLPCDVDAVLLSDENLYIFKGNNYWRYNGRDQAVLVGQTLDWNIDVVHCTD